MSELQAAHIFKYKELHPEDKTTGGESEKEQRVEDDNIEDTEFCHQQCEDGEVADESTKRAETQQELTLLLKALHMDPLSPFTHMSNEVRHMKEAGICKKNEKTYSLK